MSVYDGRRLLGSFVEADGGFLVLDADGRLIQAVGKRRDAQDVLYNASVREVQP